MEHSSHGCSERVVVRVELCWVVGAAPWSEFLGSAESKGKTAERLQKATYPLVTLRPEDFPEQLRDRASRVLDLRGKYVLHVGDESYFHQVKRTCARAGSNRYFSRTMPRTTRPKPTRSAATTTVRTLAAGSCDSMVSRAPCQAFIKAACWAALSQWPRQPRAAKHNYSVESARAITKFDRDRPLQDYRIICRMPSDLLAA
jgi:hypothetical protein